jgi:hypothetical protein
LTCVYNWFLKNVRKFRHDWPCPHNSVHIYIIASESFNVGNFCSAKSESVILNGWQILIWNYRVFLLRLPNLSLRYTPILPRILIIAHLCLEHHEPLLQIIYQMFSPLLNAEYKCYPRSNVNSLLLTNLYQEVECKK